MGRIWINAFGCLRARFVTFRSAETENSVDASPPIKSMKTSLLSPWKACMLPLLCLGSLVASGHAAVLVNDNFTNSSGTNVGTVNNTQAAGVGTYSTIQPGAGTGMSVTTVSGFGSGNVLGFANNNNTYYRGFNGSTTMTLNSLAVNESLSLSFAIRFDGSFSGADNFSFGFVGQSPANSVLYSNLDLSASGGYASEFRYRAGSFNMSDTTGTVVVGSGWTEPATVSTTAYNFELSVTKLAGGAFSIEYFRNGALTGSANVASGSGFVTAMGDTTISGIAFRHSNLPNVLTYIDNVSVVTVPEPSVALLMLGGLGLVFLRRRVLC